MSASTGKKVLVARWVELASQRGAANVAFADVYQSLRITKSSAYRASQGAVRSLVCDLHKEVVADTRSAIEEKLDALAKPILLRVALETGVCAAAEALERARLTGRVLGSDLPLLSAYLLTDHTGGFMDVLAQYVTCCTYAYGSLMEPDDLKAVARRFVTGVITSFVRALFPDNQGHVQWPSETVVRDFAEGHIAEFIRALGEPDPAGRVAHRRALTVPGQPTIVPHFPFLEP